VHQLPFRAGATFSCDTVIFSLVEAAALTVLLTEFRLS
jgi:hypothetical protein